eukprot:617210-Pleurochrysis_carterae.AAC.1
MKPCSGQLAGLNSTRAKRGSVSIGSSTIIYGISGRGHRIGSHWFGIPWGRAPLPGRHELRRANKRVTPNGSCVRRAQSRPPGPFWHLAAPKRATLQSSGAGRHLRRTMRASCAPRVGC